MEVKWCAIFVECVHTYVYMYVCMYVCVCVCVCVTLKCDDQHLGHLESSKGNITTCLLCFVCLLFCISLQIPGVGVRGVAQGQLRGVARGQLATKPGPSSDRTRRRALVCAQC